MSARVALSPVPSNPGPATAIAVARSAVTVDDALALAHELAGLPAEHSTVDRWEALATVAAHDLGAVRAIEPHLDAVGILRQAGADLPPGSFGVFAAEGGDDPLAATATADGWILAGTKPWCSLAARLDAALITAADTDGARRLLLVDLHHVGVTVDQSAWVARGLVEIPSGPVHFDDVPASPVGDPGWYLERLGFAWGGIGVAACWFGGAVGVGRSVHAAAVAKPNPHLLAHLGAIDELLESCRRALGEAASLIDAAAPTDPRLLAKRVRATVARACEEILDRAGHALGPAPLALDPVHAKRVADLALYVRQHHAERDQQSLGESLAREAAPW